MEVVLLAAVHNKEKSCHLARPGIVGDRSHDVNFFHHEDEEYDTDGNSYDDISDDDDNEIGQFYK